MIVPIEYPNWARFKADFIKTLDVSVPLIKRYLFRGQADASWSLSSSFDRAYPASKVGRDKEYAKYLKFFSQQYFRVGTDISVLNDLEAASVAQHYGVPSRLMDWSRSPYVAAFFAFYYALVENRIAGRSSKVAIWCMDQKAFNAERSKAADIARDWEIVTVRGRFNDRLQVQNGKFLRCNTDQSDFVGYCEHKNISQCLKKFVLPAREANVAVDDLILMGITPAAIYPDFDGVAKYTRLRMALEGFKL
jgi:hypothetical protein